MIATVAHGLGVSDPVPVSPRRPRPRLPLAFALALAATLAGGCNSVCTAACDKQYNDCVRKAPSGTNYNDCGEQQQQCVARCTTGRTADDPEGQPN